jgi:hypothetical protein
VNPDGALESRRSIVVSPCVESLPSRRHGKLAPFPPETIEEIT